MLSHFLTNIINNNLHYFFEKMSVQEKIKCNGIVDLGLLSFFVLQEICFKIVYKTL